MPPPAPLAMKYIYTKISAPLPRDLFCRIRLIEGLIFSFSAALEYILLADEGADFSALMPRRIALRCPRPLGSQCVSARASLLFSRRSRYRRRQFRAAAPILNAGLIFYFTSQRRRAARMLIFIFLMMMVRAATYFIAFLPTIMTAAKCHDTGQEASRAHWGDRVMISINFHACTSNKAYIR